METVALVASILEALNAIIASVTAASAIISEVGGVVSKAQSEGRDLTNDELDAINAKIAALRPKPVT